MFLYSLRDLVIPIVKLANSELHDSVFSFDGFVSVFRRQMQLGLSGFSKHILLILFITCYRSV